MLKYKNILNSGDRTGLASAPAINRFLSQLFHRRLHNMEPATGILIFRKPKVARKGIVACH